MAESHVRIDEGVKRGPNRQLRREALKQPRTKTGVFLSQLDPAKRSQIILEAPERILRGESTSQIAESYGIPASTIRSWLIGNVEAEKARGAMLAMELSIHLGAIESATDPLSLACAREAFKAWSWIAERREHRLYAQRQEVTVKTEEHISLVLEGDVSSLIERIAAKRQATQVIDLPSDAVQHLDKPKE